MAWAITPKHVSHGLYMILTAKKTYLHHLRLHVIDDSLYLLAYDGCRQIVELLYAQCILYSNRGNS